jgi:signal peptidase I
VSLLLLLVVVLTGLCAGMAFGARAWASGDAGRRRVRRIASAAGLLATLVLVGLAAVPVYGHVTGDYRILPILSGSMEPEMATGDAAWVVTKPLDDLTVGDVLVFDPPASENGGARPTTIHRVIELVPPGDIAPVDRQEGAVYVRTQGDANESADPWVAAIDDEQVWVHERTVPEVGAFLSAARTGNLRMIALLLAAAMFAFWGGKTMWQGARETPRIIEAAERVQQRRSATAMGRRPSRPAMAMGVVGAVLAGAVLASSASVLDTAQTNGTLPSGVVALETGGTTLNVPVSDLLPGQRAEALLTLQHTGTVPLLGAGASSDAIGLQLQADGDAPTDPDPLLDDLSGGLQLTVERCDTTWVAEGPGPDGRPTYSCADAGGPTLVSGARPVLGRTDLPDPLFEAYEPTGVDFLRLTLALPDTAPPSLAGEDTEVGFTILALQRGGTNR